MVISGSDGGVPGGPVRGTRSNTTQHLPGSPLQQGFDALDLQPEASPA